VHRQATELGERVRAARGPAWGPNPTLTHTLAGSARSEKAACAACLWGGAAPL